MDDVVQARNIAGGFSNMLVRATNTNPFAQAGLSPEFLSTVLPDRAVDPAKIQELTQKITTALATNDISFINRVAAGVLGLAADLSDLFD